MRIEDQVCSLEHGKELKKLGVKQDSLYSYFQYDKWNVLLRETREIFSPSNECGCNKENLICSAFTDAELGEMLPLGVHSMQIRTIQKGITRWTCTSGDAKNFIEAADTEADARAKMLIWLLKNNLIENGEYYKEGNK